MATLIERATAVGISEEQAQSMLNLLGEAAFSAALKEKEKKDHAAAFKAEHKDELDALAKLKAALDAYNEQHSGANLKLDGADVTQNRRRSNYNKESKASSAARIDALHKRYGDATLTFKERQATLLAGGKVKVGDTEYETIGKWGSSIQRGMGDMWKTVSIQVNGTSMPLGQAETAVDEPKTKK